MIAFTGSHGTGKSTTLKDLKGAMPGLQLHDGFARPIRKIFNELNLRDIDAQQTINALILWKFKTEQSNLRFAIARSPFDVAAYSQEFFGNVISEAILHEFKSQNLLEGVTFFYFPIEFELVDDGVRFLDKALQIRIDKLIKQNLEKSGVNFVTVKGSRARRLKIIINNI